MPRLVLLGLVVAAAAVVLALRPWTRQGRSLAGISWAWFGPWLDRDRLD